MSPAEQGVQHVEQFFLVHSFSVDEERSPRGHHRILVSNTKAVFERPCANGPMDNVEVMCLKPEVGTVGQCTLAHNLFAYLASI